jgi:hypothetical protein
MNSVAGIITCSDAIDRRRRWMSPAHQREAGRPMSEGRRRGADRSGKAGWPITNTHVHLPPNFSTFETAEDAVETAAAEGVRVLGASNFHDHRIYGRFADAAAAAGIVPLFGLELISVVDSLRDAGTKINDPGNPGRMYLCGKGVNPFATPTATAARLMAQVRAADTDRMRAMVPLLGACLKEAGLETALTAGNITEEVAEQAGVPREWVVLQERHVAMAFQEAIFLTAAPERRHELLARAFGRPFDGSVDHPIAVQDEIRSRLMKASRPAFVPESPVSFDDAYRLILEMDGIPCYPTLADGASPVCPWEEPPNSLAQRVLERGIHAAELIPNRNQPAVLDAYVAAFRDAGIIVMAGTEHNSRQRIPLDPRCVDGSQPSSAARAAIWEATGVVAAHQHLRASGQRGYVDRQGELNPGFPDGESRIRWFAELGAELIDAASMAVAR